MSTIDTPRGPITIRPTREEDTAAYRELRLEALLTHPEAFGATYEESLARPIERWQQNVRDGAGTDLAITYVAEAAGTLVGTTGIYRDSSAKMGHRATIWGVYVRPEWRGAGIADALIGACVSWARQQRLRLVTLSVVTTNAAAIRCYVRCGFSVYGMDPEVIYHNGVYYDELLMVRHLLSDRETR
ncbi:MAG TPA: GNAT family protein [Roseiflexaceae bacterium]|nr:GNAT family protein [Roseiflexaceae bacterium]